MSNFTDKLHSFSMRLFTKLSTKSQKNDVITTPLKASEIAALSLLKDPLATVEISGTSVKHMDSAALSFLKELTANKLEVGSSKAVQAKKVAAAEHRDAFQISEQQKTKIGNIILPKSHEGQIQPAESSVVINNNKLEVGSNKAVLAKAVVAAEYRAVVGQIKEQQKGVIEDIWPNRSQATKVNSTAIDNILPLIGKYNGEVFEYLPRKQLMTTERGKELFEGLQGKASIIPVSDKEFVFSSYEGVF